MYELIIESFQHNTHHAATNLIDHDGDINLVPVIALIPGDLARFKQPVEKFILKVGRLLEFQSCAVLRSRRKPRAISSFSTLSDGESSL